MSDSVDRITAFLNELDREDSKGWDYHSDALYGVNGMVITRADIRSILGELATAQRKIEVALGTIESRKTVYGYSPLGEVIRSFLTATEKESTQ